MEDVQCDQRLHGQFVFLHLTLTCLQDFDAALQDLAGRDLVCTAEPLTYRFMTELSAIWVILTSTVFSAGAWHYSQLLKQAEVKLISQTDCKSDLFYGDRITDNMLCAGSPDWSTDACGVSKDVIAWIICE